MNGQLAYRGLPGVVVGVVHDQQLVWSKAFGHADLEANQPMTTAAKFRMASHSKVFTATALMQLREQGKLRLDDPVSQYLPWFHPKPANPDDAPIRIENLLTHASGLPREAGPHWSNYKFPNAQGIQKYIDEHAAVLSPHDRFKYSNLAYTLAGMIVEKVSGEPYKDYIRKHIFDPLGMNDSNYDQQVPGLATGYARRLPDGTRAKLPFVSAEAMASATGLTSTVGDMARFISSQFRKGPAGGQQLLATHSLREMHRVRFMENDWQRGYAIGFAVSRTRDKIYVGHGGGYPGYLTNTSFNLDQKLGFIVLTNSNDSLPSEIAARLIETVGEAVAKATAPPAKQPQWDPAWSRYAGLYRSAFSDVEVVELNRSLIMINPALSTLPSPTKLFPLGNGAFRLEADSGGLAVGETIRFEESNGRVVRVYMGDSYSDRVNR